MAKPKRVGHLVLNVKDQTEATKFYTEVLGFEIAVERPGFGTFLTCGKIQMKLTICGIIRLTATRNRNCWTFYVNGGFEVIIIPRTGQLIGVKAKSRKMKK